MNPDEANILVPSWQLGSSLDPRSSLVCSYSSSSIVGWKRWTKGRETVFCGEIVKEGEKKGVKNILCSIAHNKTVSSLRGGTSCAVLCNIFFSILSKFLQLKGNISMIGLFSKGVTHCLFLSDLG